MTSQDQVLRTVSVLLRLEWFDDLIKTIQLTVIDLDEANEEIRLDGQTIGFIGRAGRIFVALTGTRLDRAEECGQCLLWDKAAAILVAAVGRLQKPEEPGTHAVTPGYVAGDRDRDTGQVSTLRRFRIHEMSR